MEGQRCRKGFFQAEKLETEEFQSSSVECVFIEAYKLVAFYIIADGISTRCMIHFPLIVICNKIPEVVLSAGYMIYTVLVIWLPSNNSV